MSDNISEAFVEAVSAIGRSIGVKPLPQGLNVAKVGPWSLTLNASSEPLLAKGRTVPIPPFNLLAEHDEYFVIAMFGPDGGMIGGAGGDINEASFIADMKAAA